MSQLKGYVRTNLEKCKSKKTEQNKVKLNFVNKFIIYEAFTVPLTACKGT